MNQSGVYGANIPVWTDDLWRLVDLGGFQWMVVRSDVGPGEARLASERGIEVLLQFPDHFNKHPWSHPGQYAVEAFRKAQAFKPFARYIILDNEPNLYPERAGQWYAEQFTRWFRAVVAVFRFFDHESYWRILFPGLCFLPDRNPELWLRINAENLRETWGVCSHDIWQSWGQLYDPHFGKAHDLVWSIYPPARVFITEYANSLPGLSENDKATQYCHFLSTLPRNVQCACLFILGGTEDWRDFWLTEGVARVLRGCGS